MRAIMKSCLCICVCIVLSYGHVPHTRVLNGSPALIEEYPILAQMLLDAWDTNNYVQYCAGVIVTTKHVISTAHCYQYSEDVGKNYSMPQYWKVRVGSSYRSHGGAIHRVKKIIKHYGFETQMFMNDIAIIVVSKKFTFSSYVGQATIIKDGSEIPPNAVCTLVGWGATHRDGPQPDQLQYTNMLSIDNEECKMLYNTIGAVISPSMLCAGRTDIDGVDGCFGDSGGPLIYKGVVVGLVSFGYACGVRYYPGVYTKVSHYTDWIIRTVSNVK